MTARSLASSRRVLALVACAIVTALAAFATAAPAGAAAKPHEAPPDFGLFGVQDPTYDGVYRDALSLLALSSAGVHLQGNALRWLSEQQCDDGTFTSYLANTDAPCPDNGKDSNATGLAAQAQSALDIPTDRTIAGLKTFQDSDGGFFSNKLFSADPGSDANSTGIALSAFADAGIDPTSVTSGGKSGNDFLDSVQLGCTATAATQGAYDFQLESPLAANDYATAQAVLGALGQGLPVDHGTVSSDQPTLDCPAATPNSASTPSATPTATPTTAPSAEPAAAHAARPRTANATTPAQAAAGYLARKLQAGNGLIPSAYGSGSDYTSTGNAVISLVAAGVGADQVSLALDALAAHVDDYVVDSDGNDRPAALATLILAAHAGGRDPRHFGTAHNTTSHARSHVVSSDDLVARLLATEREPIAVPGEGNTGASGSTGSGKPQASEPTVTLPKTGGRHLDLLALIGAGIVVMGVGLVVAGRRPSTHRGGPM